MYYFGVKIAKSIVLQHDLSQHTCIKNQPIAVGNVAIQLIENLKPGNALKPLSRTIFYKKNKMKNDIKEKIEIKKEVEKVQKPIKQRTGFMKIFEYLFRK